MRCAPLTPPLLALAVVTGGHVSAQTASPPSAEAAARPAVEAAALAAPNPDAASPAKVRAVSPSTAAKLAASVPKFTVPTPAPEGSAAPPPPAPETDKPRNTIIRLPSYIVREPRPPVFKPREIISPQGRTDLVFKKYPGLRFGSLPLFSNVGVGLMMLEEENRLERMKEMQDLMGLLRHGNLDPKGEVKAKMDQSFMRPSF